MGHEFVSGIMYVSAEDIITISDSRDIECVNCGLIIGPELNTDDRIDQVDNYPCAGIANNQ